MFKNNRGYILIETLVAFTIIITVMTMLVPIYSTIQQEKLIIHERSIITLYLFEQLQERIYEIDTEKNESKKIRIDNREVILSFESIDPYIKGCVTWKNVKHREETYCLYGISEK